MLAHGIIIAILTKGTHSYRGGTMNSRVSVREAASFLGVSVPTVRRWIAEHHVPFYRLGRRILLDTDELTATLQAARVAPCSEEKKAA
jgi:excisionase family DNA binding protein